MPSRLLVIVSVIWSVVAAAMCLAADPAPVDLSELGPWYGRSVTTLEIAGMPTALVGRARPGLALTPRRKLWRVRTTVLTEATARADAARVRLLLARHGYPDARISLRAKPAGARGVAVTLRIDAGPAVTYGQVRVLGLPAPAGAVEDTLQRRLAAGARFDETAVQGARDALLMAQRRAGHAQPAVDLAVVRTGGATADVTFTCRPGARFRYDGLTVEGAPPDLEPLVRRTVNLAPDTPYAPAVSARVRQDLRQLQLFRQVRITSEAHTDSTLLLQASLRPMQMITLETSVGSFTDDWLVAQAGLRHRNLFRRGRGGSVKLLWSTHRREAVGSVWWPGLLAPRSRTALDLSGAIDDEDSYRLSTVSAELSTLFKPWTAASLRVGLTVSDGTLVDRSADPGAFVDEVGLLTALGATWYRDTSDHPLDPHDGSRMTVQSEWSPPGLLTDTPFASLRVFGSRYLPLGPGTLAVRLDGGLAAPLGASPDLRPDRRFFAGGVSTMRGYRRRALGPTDTAGQAVGGEARILAGAELRVPFGSLLGAAFFVDSGQVWSSRHDVRLQDLAVAAGSGVLIYTPVGPFRIDVAVNLSTPDRDTSRWLVSLAIGHPY
ncbi:MAG: outer membrane protein assembly factor [Candidatus Krumholzibacteriia bacterium]